MSDTVTTTGTVASSAPGLIGEIETGLNVAAEVAAAAIPGAAPIAGTIAEVLPAAETAVNTVIAEAPHQTAVKDIVNIANAAAPVLQQVATSTNNSHATEAAAALTATNTFLAELKKIFAWL